MTKTPSIAVIKPNYGVNGGFERHVAGLIEGLRERSWRVSVIELDGKTKPGRLFGIPIEPVRLEFHSEYFMYLALVEQAQRLNLDHFDAVLTTQPPTYLVPHQRKVALFFHQARLHYDLAGPVMAAGMVDPVVHRAATTAIRTLEADAVGEVRFWLAGSAESAARLDQYWSIPSDLIDIYQAPPTSIPTSIAPYQPDGPVVSVGRLEWPKRAELVVQATHLSASGRKTHLVGEGSRLDHIRDLDISYRQDRDLAARSLEAGLWVESGVVNTSSARPSGPPSGRIAFEGSVSDQRRDQLYDAASVVVAPAYKEDYGLTAVEAMIRARPVIVCRDGGGLTEMITNGLNGLIVEPNAIAMAKAIDGLIDDPVRAARMGQAARRAVSGISMERAVTQVELALRRVLDHEVPPNFDLPDLIDLAGSPRIP
ncbi:MAG: glycosyltransferase family 4 protein [Actinomycetia bacterium]|nr:glycosyltransferase family 4 protein [Actinomycetes bacterium]MCP5033996.1 glycosyltransferase family 4 protein [Actinomycetes bacterium]